MKILFSTEDFRGLVQCHHTLFRCDAKARNTVWGSTNINRRVDCLLEYFVANNLDVAFIANEPIFIDIGRREVIVITSSRLSLITGTNDSV